MPYCEQDSLRAHRHWKATCGPHALAALLGKSLGEIRANLRGYKGWMSPTMIYETLTRFGARFSITSGLKTRELCAGLNRIQWEGPWLLQSPAAAYRHTHWVAQRDGWVLCTAVSPFSWIRAEDWAPRIQDPFHITHHIAVTP